jgi:hypothetical protein
LAALFSDRNAWCYTTLAEGDRFGAFARDEARQAACA